MENNEFSPLDNDESVKENGQPLPRLYSEAVIMGFAFFFSTLFASFLTIANLKEVNARRGILPVIVVTGLFTFLSLVVATQLPQRFNVLSLAVNFLGGVVLNLYFGRKYIPVDLPHENKTIQKPLLIGLALIVGLLVLSAIMANIMGVTKLTH